MRSAVKGIAFLLLLVMVLVSGCNLPVNNNADRMGKMNGTTYTNDYFGLTFKVPSDWVIATEKEKDELIKNTNAALAGNDANLKSQLDYAMVRVLYLVMVSKYPMNSSTNNPNLQCYAENLSMISGGINIKSGREYLSASVEQMKAMGAPYTFSDITSEELGGVQFDLLITSGSANGMTFKQKFYSTVMNGYAMNFVITYTNDEDFEVLDDMLKSVEFR